MPVVAFNGSGSSPLARGTLENWSPALSNRGLIPARAGNTGWVREDGQLYGAHPRSRGEHALYAVPGLVASGSSPLARGTPGPVSKTAGPMGLIPARAGNTTVWVAA